MFKINKPHLSGSIHSGHFMVSRLDDDDEDNNDSADDSSDSERDNANSVEIDVNNPDSVADANNLDLTYHVTSTTVKNEQVASWNDLDRPKQPHKHNQYLTYYTNSYNDDNGPASLSSIAHRGAAKAGASSPMSSTGQCSESELQLHQMRKISHHDHHHHHQSPAQLMSMTDHDRSMLSPSSELHKQSQHHAVTIDTSLTKLLECMSLYYSSKLTSPKWKSFKGLKLRLKYKIRLNNLIWRAWFLQCIRGRRPPGCQFTAPAETDVHKKSETIVLEGKYWKRKESAIVDEYKKWRTFHKQKSQMHCFRPSSFDWDNRVSSLASSSMYGPDYHFYPDYDMNITYNLDDLPPMLEEIDNREVEAYYSSSSSSSRVVPTQQVQQIPVPQPQQQPQQQQQQQQQQPLHRPQQQLQAAPIPQSQSLHRPQLQAQIPQQQQHPQQPMHHQTQPSPQIQQLLQPTLPPLHQQQTQVPISQSQPTHPLPHPQQQQHPHQPVASDMMSVDLYSLDAGASDDSGRDVQRRVCHINAEQKRRCNIKNGFDTLKSMLPSINQNLNVKISKASMLQKAAVYISALTSEQKQQVEEQVALEQQIAALKQTISAYQCQLPASGGPIGCRGSSQSREMLQEYIRRRTLENWKFWIFSLIIEPLFESYHQTVSTATLEDACKTIFAWLDRCCGLVSLRKDVLDSLTFLGTSTNVLNNPQTLPTEAVDAVRYQSNQQQQQHHQQQQQQPQQHQHPHHQQQQQQLQHQHQQQLHGMLPNGPSSMDMSSGQPDRDSAIYPNIYVENVRSVYETLK